MVNLLQKIIQSENLAVIYLLVSDKTLLVSVKIEGVREALLINNWI